MNSSLDFAQLMSWEDMSQAVHKLQPQMALLQATVADLQQQIADLQAQVELQEQIAGVNYVNELAVKERKDYVDLLMREAMEGRS